MNPTLPNPSQLLLQLLPTLLKLATKLTPMDQSTAADAAVGHLLAGANRQKTETLPP
jgi:hypothetical protein